MKKLFLILSLCIISYLTFSQNVAITDDDTYVANSSAMLDVKSSSKGMLVPRLTTTQRTAIPSPATGLLVYDTTIGSFYYYNGTSWTNITSGNASGIIGYTSPDKVYLTDITDKFGVGTQTPFGKMEVKSDNSLGTNDPIFQVINNNGDTVFAVYQQGVRVNVQDDPGKANGSKGGFAVGGFSPAKGTFTNEFLRVTPDSVRVYIAEGVAAKANGSKGGFAVGGFSPAKTTFTDYFNIYGSNAPTTIDPSEARIFWYPLKEAFLAGRVLVQSPDSVGLNSFATGYESKAIGNYSQAFGYKCVARGLNSFSLGDSTFASGINSFAAGYNTTASGQNATSVGSGTIASGYQSCAFGINTVASNNQSCAFGNQTTASGNNSTSFGFQTTASGQYSTAFGNICFASGIGSTAFGWQNEVTGNYSIVAGYQSNVSGFAAAALGWECGADDCGLSSGRFNSAGKMGLASGEYSIASGYGSTSHGRFVTASGDYSFAQGYRSTSQPYACVTIGRYNVVEGTSTSWVSTEPLFVAGNGASSAARNNAMTLYKNGNLSIAGTITQDSWQTPALLNSWVNYGGGYNSAGYFRDKNGIVHLQGLVKSGTAANAIIFILPAGYRPSAHELQTSFSAAGACRIDIDANGNIWAFTNGSTSWLSLDGITFRASGY